ncbi:MAG TPA: PP2C family serine/threonine-protein phosphatase [Acidimicrobiales bacterium]|nr:PP2C family serine/threonine-protein phosphatase [Acidimicrobiales bacterium]
MWHVFGGSARGRSHLASDSACQDFSAWGASGGALCIAIADGAGSRAFSAQGAKAAVETVLAWSKETFVGGKVTKSLDHAFAAAHARLVELAAGDDASQHDFATTLAVAVIDSTSVRIGQLGDSIGVVARASGVIEAVSPCPRSEYVNDTVFLTDDAWHVALRTARFPVNSITALSLSTDGLQFKILADVAQGIPYMPFFRDLFSWAAWAAPFRGSSDSLVQYLHELDDDQSDDDKTLVVAVRTNPDGAEGNGRPGREHLQSQARGPTTRWIIRP